MSETIGRLLAVGNVAEVFECGSRVLKLYRSAVRKPTHSARRQSMRSGAWSSVPAMWACKRSAVVGVSCSTAQRASFAKRMQEDRTRTGVPGDTRPTARAFIRTRSRTRQAGSKHRLHRPSRRTEKTDFAQPPCRDTKRRPPLSRRSSPHQRLGPNLAALGDRLA